MSDNLPPFALLDVITRLPAIEMVFDDIIGGEKP